MQQAQTYQQRSRENLSKVYRELEAGDLTQASEKGWGAAALMVKAVAQQRGWRHRRHGWLHDVVDDLVEETGDGELNRCSAWPPISTSISTRVGCAPDASGRASMTWSDSSKELHACWPEFPTPYQ